jgi:hypothetical protein
VRIEGRASVALPRARVFDGLLDAALLRACTPGATRLEETAPGHFEATVDLKLPAITGRFEGTADVVEREAPSRVRLRVRGKGAPGFVDGEAAIVLAESDGRTAVEYVADVTVGGQVARLGQRMISGVVKEMAAQFFEALEKAGAPAAQAGGGAAPAAPPAASPSAVLAGIRLLWRLLLRALGLRRD